MSNIDDRLRAADPVGGRVYLHRDLDAMIARVTAPAPARLDQQWAGFKLKMASAVAAASLLTLGAVTALSTAGPSLPVLALNAAGAKASVPAGSMMMVYEKFVFSAGPNLSSSPGLASAYAVQSPADPSSEAARIASIFAVTGTPQNANGSATDWTVTDPSGSTLVYQSYGGVANWSFNSSSSIASSSVGSGTTSSTPPSTPPASAQSAGTVPSTATLEDDARAYMRQLGYNYSLSDPSFSSATSSTGPTANSSSTTINEETVSYTVSIDGIATDQTAQFTVDGSNTLVDASGPAFNLGAPINYPLQSPVDGVAVLNADQQKRFAPANAGTVTPSSGAPAGAPGTTVPGSSNGSPGPTTTTTTPQGPPIVNVSLTDETVTLGTYQLDNGSVYLVPVYDYAGVASGPNANTYTGTWSTVAVAPAYAHFTRAGGGIIAY